MEPRSVQKLYGSEAYSSVNLATGEVKASIDLTGANKFVSVAGIFGDTVTFNVAEPTLIDFSFGYEGKIDVSNYNYSGSSLGTYVSVNLAVFEEGVADYTNFTSLSGALIQESVFVDFASGETSDFTTMVNDALNGSFVITGSGDKTYDVFASLSLSAAININTATVEMDFLNTGTFGISGAAFNSTSGSGLFLTGTAPSAVPIPAAAFMFAPAILGFLGLRRKTKKMAV